MSAAESPLGQWVEQCGGHLCLVFADIVSSTFLLHEIGTARYADQRRFTFDRAEWLARARKGRLIDTSGDGLFYAFQDAGGGFVFAGEFWASSTSAFGLPVRIGVHLGAVTAEGNHLLGRSVHYAARVMQHGLGSELWVSQALKDALEAKSPYRSDPNQFARRLGYPESFFEFRWLKEEECELYGFPDKQRLWRAA